ncbi:MAG TPA: endonuclease [Candidatus Omnitrophica bacterium]|nr:endonuclease [Candidatus Omnitrophota bacterium]
MKIPIERLPAGNQGGKSMLYEFRDNLCFKRLPSKRRYLSYYLAGFVDREGFFSVSIKKLSTAKFGWVVDPCFRVYQHKKNLHILELFKKFFKAGYIKPKSSSSNTYVFTISDRKSLEEKIVPFFKKHKLLTSKWEDFCKFAEIIERMKNKEHLRLEGIKRIIKIACSMNELGKQRKYT